MSTHTFDPYDHEGEDAELRVMRERDAGDEPQTPAEILAAVDADVEVFMAGNPHADRDAMHARFLRMAKNLIIDNAHNAAHDHE